MKGGVNLTSYERDHVHHNPWRSIIRSNIIKFKKITRNKKVNGSQNR